jgi:hypothetical protein
MFYRVILKKIEISAFTGGGHKLGIGGPTAQEVVKDILRWFPQYLVCPHVSISFNVVTIISPIEGELFCETNENLLTIFSPHL